MHEKPLQAALQRKEVQPFCCGLVAKEKDSEYNDKGQRGSDRVCGLAVNNCLHVCSNGWFTLVGFHALT